MNEEIGLIILQKLMDLGTSRQLSFALTYDQTHSCYRINVDGFSYILNNGLSIDSLLQAHAYIVAQIGTKENWWA